MLDPSKINADLKALKDLYLEKGYWNVRVQSQVLDSAEQDEATLVFEIMENDKREITKIGFLGNENLKKINYWMRWKLQNGLSGAFGLLVQSIAQGFLKMI